MDFVYYILKYSIRPAYKTYFRKIYFVGRDKIPKDKKIVFAVNHPTAFMEPVLVGAFIKKPVNVILRGDAFASKFLVWILRQIKTIPIFRSRDGMANLRKNEQTMEEIKQLLHKGDESILILAEGTSEHEKRLRPIQKGTARMVFDTYEKYGDEDICVIPVGVNYTDSHKFRSVFSAEVGKPLLLTDYLDIYKENKAKGIKSLTKDVQTSMREKVIHIADPEDDDMVNLILEFNRNERIFNTFPYLEKDISLAKEEWRIVENINKKSKEERLDLAKETDAYCRRLHEYRAEDLGAAQRKRSNFANWSILFLLLPFHILGIFWNYPPMRLAKHMADRKSTEIKFHASIRFAVGYLSWAAWYLLWVLFAAVLTNWLGALAVAVLMPVLGRLSLIYGDLREEVSAAYCFNSLPEEEQKAVLMLREKILNKVR